jgi:tetratricopeptide (TPR) repeat protein
MNMQQGSESFWADIKRYEDILANDPGSYCFAPLSELYRRVGLLDDAIAVARRGIELHPDYVGGHMALGRACHEKGEVRESRAALERVVRVTPDNILAQKLLSQIYTDAGDMAAARKALETILALNPDELESKVALEALVRAAERRFEPDEDLFPEEAVGGGALPSASLQAEDVASSEQDEDILELWDEVIDEPEPETSAVELESVAQPEQRDPFSTVTIAELYVSQGFLKKALNIYRVMSDADPGNDELRTRLFELKQRIDEDEALARENALVEPLIPEGSAGEAFNGDTAGGVPSEVRAETVLPQSSPGTPVAARSATDGDRVVAKLEEWLDAIERIRACRSARH